MGAVKYANSALLVQRAFYINVRGVLGVILYY